MRKMERTYFRNSVIGPLVGLVYELDLSPNKRIAQIRATVLDNVNSLVLYVISFLYFNYKYANFE